MGIYFNPPPQQVAAGRPLLDTRKGVPPSILHNVADQPPRARRADGSAVLLWWREPAPVRVASSFVVQPAAPAAGDSPPFAQGWLAGALAWWDLEFSPVFTRGFLVQGAAAAVEPVLSLPRVQLRTVVDAWRAPAAQPRQSPATAIQPRIGDDPPRRAPATPALRTWWLSPDPVPQQARVTLVQGTPPVTNEPPPVSRVNAATIVAAWREPPPRPRQAPPLVNQPRTGDEPPRRSDVNLATTFAAWRTTPAVLPARVFAVQEAAAPERVAFGRLWLQVVLQSWIPPEPIRRRFLLHPGLLNNTANNPPFGLPDPRVLLARAWEPGPPQPKQRGPVAAIVPPPPPPPVNDPPFGARDMRPTVLAAWVPPPRFVLQHALSVQPGGGVTPPEVWVPVGMRFGGLGSATATDATDGIGSREINTGDGQIGSGNE